MHVADEVVDVTRRYTKKFDEVLTRRTRCSEDFLSRTIASLNAQRRAMRALSKERLAELDMRKDVEIKEFEGGSMRFSL